MSVLDEEVNRLRLACDHYDKAANYYRFCLGVAIGFIPCDSRDHTLDRMENARVHMARARNLSGLRPADAFGSQI